MAAAAPLPPPSGRPTQRNPWLITVLGIILGCCFFVGCIGLLIAFGPDVLHELGF